MTSDLKKYSTMDCSFMWSQACSDNISSLQTIGTDTHKKNVRTNTETCQYNMQGQTNTRKSTISMHHRMELTRLRKKYDSTVSDLQSKLQGLVLCVRPYVCERETERESETNVFGMHVTNMCVCMCVCMCVPIICVTAGHAPARVPGRNVSRSTSAVSNRCNSDFLPWFVFKFRSIDFCVCVACV